MRPTTNPEMARALRDASHYANDSETLWLMQEAANRLDAIDAPEPAPSSAASAESTEEQNAPAAAKPQRLPRAAKKDAE